jgi:hypothetical protein
MDLTRVVAAGALAVVLADAAAGPGARAEDIVFPPDAGIVDVTKNPYGAKGDGKADDTAAIQKALSDYPNAGAIIYLPNGAYLVSETLKWPHGNRGGWEEKRTVLQGQSEAGTVLKLPDNAPGYGDPARRKAMVWTGQKPAQRFGNAIRNLTFDTGRGNRGAAAVQFMANNQGIMEGVTIRSGDGQGAIGLDMAYSDEIGPCLVKNVTVIGFDVGIKTAFGVDSMVFEHIRLEGQGKFGFHNDGQCVAIRGLVSRNAVPAVFNGGGSSLLAIIDSRLTGVGAASDRPAIVNSGALFARSIRTAGYQEAVASTVGGGVRGPHVAELTSYPATSLFGRPGGSLGLPIRETPDVPWDGLDQWANGAAEPTKDRDITKSLQAAVDSGKTTVYIPRGGYKVTDTVLIRGAVRRIIGCEARLDAADMVDKPAFKVVDGAAPAVVFERISGGYSRTTFIEHAAARTLVVRSCCNVNCYAAGAGDLFLEDVCSNPFTSWRFKGRKVWARQFNVENEGTHVVNDGGTLWVLGLKTERGGTLIETTGGGKTEVIGGFCYTTTPPKGAPMFVNQGSWLSVTLGEACFGGQPYQTLISETRGGETRTLKRGDVPGRAGGSLIMLYTGHPAAP